MLRVRAAEQHVHVVERLALSYDLLERLRA